MKTKRAPRWRRAVLATLTGGACLAAGLPGPTTAAEAAAAEPCPAAFPVGDLTDGLVGNGLTVEKGNVADPFTATHVGVVDDGIGIGVDMIIMELDSPALDRAGGVWSGMSGSPVYAPDGRLIGAVSYGLSFGPSKIAGITPAADMLRLLSGPAATATRAKAVSLPAELRRELVAEGAASAREVGAGMRQLPMPLGVSGLSSARLGEATKRFGKRLSNVQVYSASGGSSAAAAPASIFPGSNFAAAISYGDLTAAGIGTTTAVCGEEALAFGHPFEYAGATTLSAHASDAVFVQPESAGAPFKVANLGGVVGTVDQDRLAGIRGAFTAAPAATPVTTDITSDSGRTRAGRTDVNVESYLPDVAALHTISNLDAVADRIGGGTVDLQWTVRGTRASGAPFEIELANRYASTFDVTYDAVYDLYDTVAAIVYNEYEDAKITAVEATGSVDDTYRSYSVASVSVRHPSGKVVPLSEDEPLVVTAGSRLNLVVGLRPYKGNGAITNVNVSVAVPAGTAEGAGYLGVFGGYDGFPEEEVPAAAQGLDVTLKELAALVPNNTVSAALYVRNETPDGDSVERYASGRAATDEVVQGGIELPVIVAAPTSARAGVVDGTTWRLRPSLSAGKASKTFSYGRATDQQVLGDWDGNGSKSPAVFRNGAWYIRRSWTTTTLTQFRFGQAGDVPVVGDWDGDGRDSIGVFRNGRWLLRNVLSAGAPSHDLTFGTAGQLPVVGDWNGDGFDSVGVFKAGRWAVRNWNSTGPAATTFGFGGKGDIPVTGEWDGDGRDEVGVYRKGTWLLRNTMSAGRPNSQFTFGGASSRPVVGG